jgi:cysteine-S-conjugate beta-lyase
MDDPAILAALRGRTSAKWRAYPDDVIPAWIAEMDVELAEPIADALHDAVRRSDTGYRWPGDLPLALAEFAAARWDWQVDPGHVLVLPDVLTCIRQSIEALTEPDAGIVVNPPVYPPFFSSIRQAGRRIVEVPLTPDDAGRLTLDLEGIERAFAMPGVGGYLLCSPHNPTGALPTRDALERIARAAQASGVVVVADEIHAPLAYPGATHVPYLSVAPSSAPAVSLLSASKGWNLAGLKCAQVVAGSASCMERLQERVPMEAQFATGHFGVIASIAAYRESGDWLDATVLGLQANARLLGDLIADQLPAVRYQTPDSSYLAWLDMRDLGLGDDPSAVILERGRVALSAGAPFGESGAGFARLNFGTSPELLRSIVARITAALR